MPCRARSPSSGSEALAVERRRRAQPPPSSTSVGTRSSSDTGSRPAARRAARRVHDQRHADRGSKRRHLVPEAPLAEHVAVVGVTTTIVSSASPCSSSASRGSRRGRRQADARVVATPRARAPARRDTGVPVGLDHRAQPAASARRRLGRLRATRPRRSRRRRSGPSSSARHLVRVVRVRERATSRAVATGRAPRRRARGGRWNATSSS